MYYKAYWYMLDITRVHVPHTPRRIKEYLPRVVQGLHTSATGGGISHDQRYQEYDCRGSVYDSNDDVGAEGLPYPSTTPTPSATTD